MGRRTKENPDAQQVCLEGHQITAHYHDQPESRQEHCDVCGKATIYTCPQCQVEIPGGYYIPDRPFVSQAASRATRAAAHAEMRAASPGKDPPAHCRGCGSPFPWTVRASKTPLLSSATPQREAVEDVIKICTRFHLIVRQLQDRHDNRVTLTITDEYDVQDLLHSLLRLFFDDVRAEDVVPSYAGSASRIDFLLNNEALGVEVKKASAHLRAKEIGNQLLIDIARYRKHAQCQTLVCLVYDPEELIQNPAGLEGDLSGEREGLNVRVLIVPKRH